MPIRLRKGVKKFYKFRKWFTLWSHGDKLAGWFGDSESPGKAAASVLSHFPQKHRNFRANGFLAIR
jgi:hypothetical protein